MFLGIRESQLRFPDPAEAVENICLSSIWCTYGKEILFNLCYFGNSIDERTSDR